MRWKTAEQQTLSFQQDTFVVFAWKSIKGIIPRNIKRSLRLILINYQINGQIDAALEKD